MNFEEKLNKLMDEVYHKVKKDDYVFLSLGKHDIKAQVKLFKKTKYLKQDISKSALKFKKKSGEFPEWIKLDIVMSTEKVLFKELKKTLVTTRRNYVDFGIAFDSLWNLAVLPEEINANAFIRPDNTTKKLFLSEKNINNYLRKYTTNKKVFSSEFYNEKEVIKFYTKGFFIDDEEVYELHSKGYRKGLRKTNHLEEEIDQLIESSTTFLQNMLLDSGKYIYGYFPHFDKEIRFYNILRHSSSTYALIEGLAYLGKSLQPVEKAIDYVISNQLLEVGDKAYIYDDTNESNEIKLGQNASFIFAVCEYLKHEDNLEYLKSAQKVAKGILTMIDKNTYETTHILNYPDLSVKEKFRIIYYDGEAALALLRLYQKDKNELWLKTVEKLMDRFIEKKYWQYHDHWLGYCTNELVQINPQDRYFEFGIKNVNNYLDYIKNRETTFPTFLEMLMATYRLVKKAKETGFEELVNHLIDEKYLKEVIDIRADYQRVGFFYPEIAMYFKNPSRILGSFFIKHHGYRVRIDDIEHYLSGYVQYQREFKE
ncbi:poly(glycerol-phosphate) alpha-glucosyltransferase [Staphylococcus simulans]|uniref:poly(glycerol-phosphate) alpha-glucosyltransferase n=1 Tax=Staphylococcus simulans TaxID=1286 RepID=UPI000BBD4036|nr:poly(glycerol-phosphate) alpha-glucosyltransferase [Staphylococcus simulans]ATF29488.1 poly(glycerol-phosphate) alpha-glucosyltransferase [Staphylococcus simulans]MBO0386938.1 poly(glycerol-phosphate) alpha-glucosyltransferase [Staphylococcus simulans]